MNDCGVEFFFLVGDGTQNAMTFGELAKGILVLFVFVKRQQLVEVGPGIIEQATGDEFHGDRAGDETLWGSFPSPRVGDGVSDDGGGFRAADFGVFDELFGASGPL